MARQELRGGVNETAARAAIARIAASKHLENKEAQKRLLQYLIERTIDGTAAALKEYTVGVECFGKAEGYDPQSDSSVRVHLGKLRKLLEEYASGEGLEDEVRVSLPQRQFTLSIAAREPEAAATRRGWWRWAGAAGAGAGLGWLAGNSRRPRLSPVLAEFWRPMGEGARRSIVCLGTPLFFRYRGAFVRVPGQEDFETFSRGEVARKLGEALGDSEPVEGHEYTGAGEGSGAFLIAQTLARGGVYPQVRRSHLLTWEEIKNDNVVFLGSAKYIPQLRQLPEQPDFLADRLGVLNPRPRPGEPEIFRGKRTADGDLLEHHAVISRIWGPGRQAKLWLIGGSSTGATLAAVETACSEEKLAALFFNVRRPGEALPQSIEIVVKAEFRREVAVGVSYVTHRVR